MGDHHRLVIHATYHKAGTVWFKAIFTELAQAFGWNLHLGDQKRLPPEADLWLSWHSQINFPALRTNYRCSHMIRDPRDMIVSGYFYHLWCDEGWCHVPRHQFGGRTYQEQLLSLPKEDGLLCEIRECQKEFKRMRDWDYDNPRVMEMKYEETILSSRQKFQELFAWYGFDNPQVAVAMDIVTKCSFEAQTKRPLGETRQHCHLRQGMPGDWRNHFGTKHVKLFRKLYPKLLGRTGYERHGVSR